MKITAQEHLLIIDFERPEALWLLLVADDRWDHVQRMVCGNPTIDDQTRQPLEKNCVDYRRVKEYWESRQKGQKERFIQSLLLLPWVAYEEQTIGKIVFSQFPPQSLSALLELVTSRQSIAALIDVISEAGTEESERSYFQETWQVLDDTKVSPRSARCMFTRGGAPYLVSQYAHVPTLSKQSVDQGEIAFQANFRRWWRTVQGDLATGAAIFQQQTTGNDLHEPSTLRRVPRIDIATLLDTMKQYDSFGVWSWCERALGEAVNESFQRSFLAAKALQTCPSNKLPVVGLIALIYGFNSLRPDFPYGVSSMLETIPIENTDSIEWFGNIKLEGFTSQNLATALGNWINHPEQFVNGHTRVMRIQISIAENMAQLAIAYSRPLPVTVLNRTDRIGNACSALEALRTLTSSFKWNDQTNTLHIEFKHEQ
jgi:hypothetical protein